MKTWVLFDISASAHRAKHSTGDLSFEGVSTGVAFGVLRDLQLVQERFDPYRVVLAFDAPGRRLRKEILPTYKSSRENKKTVVDRELDAIFYPQLDRLRDDLLPRLGYRNCVSVAGYEADDIIAQYAQKLPAGDDAVIVSSDQDLWQCLDSNVVCFNLGLNKITTSKSFYAEWGIDPCQWAHVKALAGCSTDDVPGIPGIGEKSAAGWFSGTLKVGSKKWDLINSCLSMLNQNLPLVKLPFAGLVLPEVKEDELTEGKRTEILEELGIRRRRKGGPPKAAAGEVSGVNRLF